MVRSVQPQVETRMRFGRKKLIIQRSQRRGTTCHAGSHGKAPLSVGRQKKGVRENLRPELLLEFLREGKAG